MPQDSVIVGIVLLAVVPLVVWDAVSSLGAGFSGAFWAAPLEEKLGTIDERQAAWHRLSIVWIPITGLLMAGFTALTFQLAGEGEVVWSALGLGAFLVVAVAFTPASLLMVATITRAARDHRETGSVPAWALPVWQSTWWIERAFVIGGNLAYVAWGIAIVRSGYPATWAGWVAIVSGGLIAIWASTRGYFYQHMVLITPIALGVALLLV